MLHWAHLNFPHLRYLVRADDDIYLRPGPLLRQLDQRPPVGAKITCIFAPFATIGMDILAQPPPNDLML